MDQDEDVLPASPGLAILLMSGTHERAHYAFMMAAAAAALGRPVVLFAASHGCRALRDDWSGLDDVGRDAVIRRGGIAGLGELRDSARELGVRLMLCETSMLTEAIEKSSLVPGAEIAGIASFLEAAGQGQLISL